MAVAAAEMAIGGGYGWEIDLCQVPVAGHDLSAATFLFAESPSRFLIEITPEDAEAFERFVRRVPHAKIGQVIADPRIRVDGADGVAIDADIHALRRMWQAPLGASS